MKRYSEIKLYVSQFTAGYISGKNVCAALGECLLVLPEKGVLYARVKECIHMLLTGEDLPEKNPLRSSLSVIDEGEPSLVVFHDMIVWSESIGRTEADLFRTYEEMISFLDETPERIQKRLKRKNNNSAATYERIRKCRRKNASSRLKKELIKDLKNELILFMTSMIIYTRMTGVSQALKKTHTLTHGLIKNQVKNLRKAHESGEDMSTVCKGFLSELELSEVTQCVACCFAGEADRYVIPMSGILFINEGSRRKRRIPGKEICAVFLAVVLGTMGIMGMITKEDKREGRLRNALSHALLSAVGEMKDEKGTNQIMAGFMQKMLREVDDDIALTVRICDLDELDQTMEVEAIGEYDSFLGDRRRISVRRRLSF